jgi:hypothetical protein
VQAGFLASLPDKRTGTEDWHRLWGHRLWRFGFKRLDIG